MKPIGDISRRQAKERPEQAAFVCEGRTITYAEFDERSNRIGNVLLGMDIEPQSRVAYLGRNTPAYFELLVGAAKARHVTVGINARLAPPEIEFILRDAGVRLLLVDRNFYAIVAELAEGLPDLLTVVALDGGHPAWPSYEDWLDAQPPTDPRIEPATDDDLKQLYTSGTTGLPKGVCLTHEAAEGLCGTLAAEVWKDFEPGDRKLLAAPVFHIAGSNMGLISLNQGGTCIVLPAVDPQEILRLVSEHQVNHLFLVPALILALVSQPNIGDFDLSSLKTITYGASPINEALLARAFDIFGCPFIQFYGLTENYGAATWLPWEDHAPGRGKLRSCGKPYELCDLKIVDEHGKPLGAGQIGEICVRSPWTMRGYWNRPEATAETIRNDWLHTGDAGYLDEEGYLYIHDRIKDMIVSGGENVYPAEVENAIFGHPDVADVAVIGVPDETWGEAVKAIVVLKPGARAGEDDIRAHARDRIAGFKVPKSVDFVADLPRNPSGKILRRELRERYWAGQSRRVN